VEAAGVDAAGVDAAGVEAAGVEAAGVEAAAEDGLGMLIGWPALAQVCSTCWMTSVEPPSVCFPKVKVQ
jgi:hypothetical protein